jgi:hypothetical protein
MGFYGQRHAPAALPPGRRLVTLCTGGWVGSWAGLDGCGKSHTPASIRSSDRPARSQSLYRLRFPGPLCLVKAWWLIFNYILCLLPMKCAQLIRNVETVSARQIFRLDASHLKLLNIFLLNLVLDLHTRWFHLSSYWLSVTTTLIETHNQILLVFWKHSYLSWNVDVTTCWQNKCEGTRGWQNQERSKAQSEIKQRITVDFN